MTSAPVRDPLADHLITPQNAAFPLPELADLLQDDKPLDRTTVNSWEDIEFLEAVRATGRRKLILCALWTEVCMAFTALDALREGYEVYRLRKE
jgi:nicotinamidase-related amidase